jgi:hypothetical protein
MAESCLDSVDLYEKRNKYPIGDVETNLKLLT